MRTRFVQYVLQLRKRLWAKPLLYYVIAVSVSFVAQVADYWSIGNLLPEITPDTIQTLLTIISSSMLAVPTFAVGQHNRFIGNCTPNVILAVIPNVAYVPQL